MRNIEECAVQLFQKVQDLRAGRNVTIAVKEDTAHKLGKAC